MAVEESQPNRSRRGPSRPRVVFLTGAARSGTTWVQNMLGSHPEIATPQESDLISRYIAPWYREWRKSLPDDPKAWADRRHNGLPSIITEEEFDAIVRETVERIYSKAWEQKPSASIILDKVPGYGYFGGLILKCLPDARILHLIRDGRDVTLSLRRASKGFGRAWAAGTVDYAAWAWQSNVEAARELSGWECYRELRYEELRGPDGAAVLRHAFQFLGVDVTTSKAHEIVERFSLEGNKGRPPSSMVWGGEVAKRLAAEPEEPADFFGSGSTDGWRDRFTWYDRWMFDRYAGQLLVGLGYEPDRSWARVGPLRRVTGHIRFFAERWRILVGSLSKKVRRNIKPRDRKPPPGAVPAPSLASWSRTRRADS